MTIFETELKNNRFVCSECIKCNKLVWPPNDFCNSCFNKVRWRPMSRTAKLIEFSKQNDTIFCIAEFENTIRIIGKLETNSQKLSIGQELNLIRCDYDGQETFIFQLK